MEDLKQRFNISFELGFIAQRVKHFRSESDEETRVREILFFMFCMGASAFSAIIHDRMHKHHKEKEDGNHTTTDADVAKELSEFEKWINLSMIEGKPYEEHQKNTASVTCPVCNDVCNNPVGSHVGSDKLIRNPQPAEGDVAICGTCCSVLIYKDSKIRAVTEEDLVKYPDHVRQIIEKTKTAAEKKRQAATV